MKGDFRNWVNLKKLVAIAENAGQLILQVYHTEVVNFDISYKNDDSPLTIADQKANKYICEQLRSEYPDVPIVSEENKNDSYETRKNYTYCWFVDPLDGTKEFIKRNGEFTVNIGLVKNGKPVAGVVHIPVTGETFVAGKDMGAFKKVGNHKEEIEREGVTYPKTKKEGVTIIASKSHMNDETRDFIGRYKDAELISVGSSIKLIWIAIGKADIYPRIAPTMEWDTCAAHAIVNEMGGKVLKFNSEEELEYNKENLLNPYFVCFIDETLL